MNYELVELFAHIRPKYLFYVGGCGPKKLLFKKSLCLQVKKMDISTEMFGHLQNVRVLEKRSAENRHKLQFRFNSRKTQM